jgi:small multidrug resistance pump
VAVLSSVGGGSCLKLSAGFTRLVPSILIFVFYTIDTVALALAIQEFDMGIFYAIWTGLSTILLTVVGLVFFKESADIVKIMSIGFVILGTIILEMV